MSKIPIYSNWKNSRNKSKEDLRKENFQLEIVSNDLQHTIDEQKLKVQNYLNDIQEIQNYGAVYSTDTVTKKGRMDKIRAQRVEIEVKDGERVTTMKAKVVEGYFIEFRYRGQKQKKIIVTRGIPFEYVFIPFFSWRRGLKFYILAHEEMTCNAFSTVPKLTQAVLAMKIFKAVKEAETWVEVARATKSTDRKVLTMWLVTIGIISIVGILAAGQYFK